MAQAQANSLEVQLNRHINEIEQSPSDPLNQRLFEECEHFLVAQIVQNRVELLNLITILSSLLSKVQQDPTPVIRLLSKLVESLSFSDVLALQPPVDFVGGLDHNATPYNSLVLSLLRKAVASARDAAVLAGMPEVLSSLVRLWLSTSDMGIADKSSALLVDLLKVDKEVTGVAVHGTGGESINRGGQGLIWRRLFGDKDVYGLFYSIPSLADHSSQDLSKRQKSVSQARLMSILPQIGLLDWSYSVRSHHTDIESQYGLRADEGLLHFVSLHLVDYKNDVLLHMNILQFFADLISTVRMPSPSNTLQSVSLYFMVTQKLHNHAMSFWLEPDAPSHDPVDLTFLYGPSAHYMAVYVSLYQTDLLSSNLPRPVLQRLSRALDISANQWAHRESPKHDLSVLSSVPRLALLPQPFLSSGRQSSPLLLVPCKVANEDALYTLATIFGGPREIIFPANPSSTASLETEKQAARLLFYYYLATHDSLFSDLITHADTVALPSKALAAIALLSVLVSASWAALPSSPPTSDFRTANDVNVTLPTESDLQNASLPLHTAYHIPPSGESLILHPPARDTLLPYLLRPARSFSNLVGGRGDTESAAYRIAMAKWELLLLVQRGLEALEPGQGQAEAMGLVAVKAALERRTREGPWGGEGAELGGRIATMEL